MIETLNQMTSIFRFLSMLWIFLFSIQTPHSFAKESGVNSFDRWIEGETIDENDLKSKERKFEIGMLSLLYGNGHATGIFAGIPLTSHQENGQLHFKIEAMKGDVFENSFKLFQLGLTSRTLPVETLNFPLLFKGEIFISKLNEYDGELEEFISRDFLTTRFGIETGFKTFNTSIMIQYSILKQNELRRAFCFSGSLFF